MKKLFKPEIEIVEFGTADVIATSVPVPGEKAKYVFKSKELQQGANETKTFAGLTWNNTLQ